MQRRIASLALAGVSLLATAAAAQTTEAPPAATAADVAAPTDRPEASDDVIIVTGSRIARPELQSANPIVGITAAAIQQSGKTNLTDYLTRVPALAASLTNHDTSGSLANYDEVGLNLLDLRNLGTNRTLVLVDGRRHVAAESGTAAVDINAIPTDLVERVEVLTGGASAVYGADGVSGVVNFILKKDFEGVSARGQLGISAKGDGGNRFGAVTVGKNFSEGRGNIAFAYEYNKDSRVDELKRSYLRNPTAWSLVQNPDDLDDDPNVPDRIPFRDVRYADSSPEGAVDIDDDYIPDYEGNGRLYDRGRLLPNSGGYTVGGSSTPIDGYQGDVLPRSERHLANLIGHYEFSDAFNLFAEGKYVRTRAFTLAQPTFDYYLFQGTDNPYMPSAIRDAIVAGNLEAEGLPDGALVTRDNYDLGTQGADATRETWRGVIGANGKISDHARYELSYVYGQTKSRVVATNNRYTDRYMAAIDVVTDPATGQPTCRINLPGATLVDPTFWNYAVGEGTPLTFRPGECVPFNVFGNGAASKAAIDWVTTDSVSRSKITQQVASGQLTGDFGALFELPGGPVGFALGGEWRREASDFVPDADLAAGYTWYGATQRQRGDFEVKEAFAELSAPVLSDVPFAETLAFSAAIRFSDYTTIGKTTAWKVDGVYAPIRDIRFRATYSESVRAPNISELFGPQTSAFEFITDPCDINERNNGTSTREANCQALLQAVNGAIDFGTFNPSNSSEASVSIDGLNSGNPGLAEEKAKTWTAGIVLEPRFIRGLSISVDWYDIRLRGAVNQPTAQELAELCVDQPTLDNKFCPLTTRDGETGYINGFLVRPENVAEFRTAGADIKVNYEIRTAKAGTFNISVVGNYLDRLTFTPSAGAQLDNNLGDANQAAPRWQTSTDLTWTIGKLTVNYGLRWQDKTNRYDREQLAGDPDTVDAKYLKIKERWEHDIQAAIQVDDRFELYGGVNNFTNQKPAFASVFYPVSALGRFFYAGARVKLADLF